jgi:hypothetical protein
MKSIIFESKIMQINNFYIVKVPKNYSSKLPSRGMVMIKGFINKFEFKVALEPDGEGSHFFIVSNDMYKKAKLTLKEKFKFEIESIKTWEEPKVPDDLHEALKLFNFEEKWNIITTKARWEWIRWIRFTNNLKTREKRIKTVCSMLESGKKRPCCFDNSRCTLPEISKKGILII